MNVSQPADSPSRAKTSESSSSTSIGHEPLNMSYYEPWPAARSSDDAAALPRARASSVSTRAATTRLPDSSDGDSEPRRRMGAARGAQMSPSHASDQSFSSVSEVDEYKTLKKDPAVQGHERMTAFFEEVSNAHIALDQLKQLFDQTRALSERLRVLHPNDLSVPYLALELRDHLKAASRYLVHLDETIHTIYDKERETRTFNKLGRVQIGEEDLWESKEETDDLVARFLRRVKEIKREARGERRDRKAEGERNEPPALDDWLACEGVAEVQTLMRRDSVPASRYVVTNPFTVLARLTNGMESLTLPNLVPKGARPPPSTRRRSKTSKSFFPSSPTPIGSVKHPLADWKAAIIAAGRGRDKNKLERGFDELAEDLEEGWIEMKQAVGRESKERWIIWCMITLPIFFLVLWIVYAISDSGKDTISVVSATMMAEASSAEALRSGSYAIIRARGHSSI